MKGRFWTRIDRMDRIGMDALVADIPIEADEVEER
jgi:hypothetical protein